MRVQCIHAHFDDFEFVAAGTFESLRRRFASAFQAEIVVCTDGKAGHHFRTREETGKLRLEEQGKSAELGKYQFRALKLPDGTTPREGCIQVNGPFLAALWKSIRDFRPDYIFSPPLPAETLAGVHVDHWAVAEAVRKVAYLINVPHAFTPEYPADEKFSTPCKTPVILNVHDSYMTGTNAYDLAVDVEEVFPLIAEMTWCHQSQIVEWLPWIGRHDMPVPQSIEEWKKLLKKRFIKRNYEVAVASDRIYEYFTVTAWGEVPLLQTLLTDFPMLSQKVSNLEKLEQKLKKWQGH
ncbi:MAG: PIG-L family deacetylase [Verrucomicrobiota bacterium]|nr:PIG-L family deacetylase [Verrucomicrobiota bacterium]